MALNWRNDLIRYKKYFLNVGVIYNQRREVKMFLEIILSILTITMFALFAVRPTLLTIGKLVTEIETKEKTLEQLNTKITNLQTARTVYDDNEDVFPLLNVAVPDKPAIEFLVRQIVGASQKHNLELTAMTIGETALIGPQKARKENKDLVSLPANSDGFTFSFSAVGSYQDLSNFAKDVENLIRPLQFDRFTYSTAETKQGKKIILTVEARGVHEKN